MRPSALARDWFFRHSDIRLLLEPDKGGAAGGASEASGTTAAAGAAAESGFDAQLLSNLPGGELLKGATANLPEEQELVVRDWEPGDGELEEGEERDEEKEEEGDKSADAGTEKKKEEPATEDARKDWPEAARTQFAEIEKERDALKSEKETLAGEVETLKAARPEPVLAPTAEQPLANVTSDAALNYHASLAKDVKSWATRHLATGGELPADLYARLNGQKPEDVKDAPTLTAEQVAGLLERSDSMLSEAIPARREYLQTERETGEWLKATYPQYLDGKTDEGKLFAGFLQQFPQVKQLPRWQTALAALVRGHMEFEREHSAREAAKAGKTTAAAAAKKDPPKAPVPPGTGSAGTAARPVTQTSSAAKANNRKAPKLSASMDAESLARAL